METMYAAVLEGLGNWNYKKVPIPECGDNEIIVQTKRSGICSTDVVRSMRTGFYFYPVIPGHEFCGAVAEKGMNVQNVEIDDRVAVYPIIPCKKCHQCIKGKYNLCDKYDYLGSRSDGGYAEFVKCPAENAVKIPRGVSFEEAVMTEPAAVTLHAHRITGNSETVAVMGLGPIGIMTAQWARTLGAKKIICVDRNDHRFKIAKTLGLDHLVDTRDAEASTAINEATDGSGADTVFECSGSDELQTQSVLSAAKGGKVVFLGNPMKNFILDQSAFSRILRREISITGSWNSLTSANEWDESLNAIKEKKINPLPVITHGFHLSEAKQVIEDMHFKRFEFSKVSFYF
ncbi:MAG: galactitol-1-phosphate 5-dehydrogenase [Candidatus Aenigmarchaeota archaeon]|nr:galactitol-1-phosphate 5-dehydrogenase [Candidatus Aenigmarchaeota archaeon]